MPVIPADLSVRFWAKVVKGSEPDSCWLWTGSQWLGYGRFNAEGKTVRAHRFAYAEHFGPVPDGLDVLHRCDNPSCCNPAHLVAGSHADNMIDREIKGRHNAPRGSQHGRAKMTEEIVRDLRRRISEGEKANALAAEYGVSAVVAGLAINRKTWRHVP